jgi:hypothetical protein
VSQKNTQSKDPICSPTRRAKGHLLVNCSLLSIHIEEEEKIRLGPSPRKFTFSADTLSTSSNLV